MCDNLRKIDKEKFIQNYPRGGSRQEKLDSKLMKEFKNATEVSVFKIDDTSKIPMILAALTATREKARAISYTMIGDIMATNKESGGTPWAYANSRHRNLETASEDLKIQMADAMFDGHQSTMVVSENELITNAWKLINSGDVSRNDFKWCNL